MKQYKQLQFQMKRKQSCLRLTHSIACIKKIKYGHLCYLWDIYSWLDKTVSFCYAIIIPVINLAFWGQSLSASKWCAGWPYIHVKVWKVHLALGLRTSSWTRLGRSLLNTLHINTNMLMISKLLIEIYIPSQNRHQSHSQ